MSINFDLATAWALIIAFAVFAYVVMDGFDLGIGIVVPERQRVLRFRSFVLNLGDVGESGHDDFLVLCEWLGDGLNSRNQQFCR